MWLAYTDNSDNTIRLCCRYDREATTAQFQQYIVPESATAYATSDYAPAISGYDGKIYVAWIEKGTTNIKYQCTDDCTGDNVGGNWLPDAVTLDPEYMSNASPVLRACNGLLYIGFLADTDTNTYDIYFGYYNGTYWETPARQKIDATTYINSPYPPSFSVVNTQTLRFYYGKVDDYSLWYADYVPHATTTPYEIDDGKWTTQLPSALAFRKTEFQPWVFTVDPDPQVSMERPANAINMIAPATAFTAYTLVDGPSASPKFATTLYQPAALLVPGIQGDTAKPSRIFVFWKDKSDGTLYEAAFQIEKPSS